MASRSVYTLFDKIDHNMTDEDFFKIQDEFDDVYTKIEEMYEEDVNINNSKPESGRSLLEKSDLSHHLNNNSKSKCNFA